MNQRTERLAIGLALATAIFLGVRPYLSNLRLPPNTTDGVFWVVRSDPSRPDWSEWVFHTQHFDVGYRPIAGLSYTLNHLAGGLDPLPYRATDLGLFALAGLLVYALFRHLARDLPRWAGVMATGVFMAHPSTQHVVPILARRSYLLAAVFGLAALVAFCASLSRHRAPRLLSGWDVGVGALLCAAILSNEAGVVTVLVLPLVAYREAGASPHRWRFALRRCAGPAALALVTIVYRLWIVGGIGGYALQEPRASSAPSVFVASWHSLVPWIGMGSPRELLGSLVFALLVVPFYLWRALVAPLSPARSPAQRLPLVLVAWLLGYALLYAVLGIWWHRMSFPLLVPFSLLVASVLGATFQEERTEKLPLVGAAMPQIALLVLIACNSAAVHGQSPAWLQKTQQRAALIDSLQRDLGALPEPAAVLTVLPIHVPGGLRRDGIAPLLWTDALLDARDISLDALLFYERADAAPPRVERPRARLRLPLPGGRTYFVPSRGLPGVAPSQRRPRAAASRDHPERDFFPLRLGAPRAVDLNALDLPPGRNAYVYVYDGSVGTMTPLR